MRILIVAPDSDLQNLAELVEAAGENVPIVLRGTVTGRELLQRLRSEPYDVVHFAGHGTSMELGLSDGPLSVELLSSAIQDGMHPTLMFFNACASLPQAAQLHGYGVGYTIGWRQEDVPDKAAGAFAVTFYNSLRLNGGNVRQWAADGLSGIAGAAGRVGQLPATAGQRRQPAGRDCGQAAFSPAGCAALCV